MIIFIDVVNKNSEDIVKETSQNETPRKKKGFRTHNNYLKILPLERAIRNENEFHFFLYVCITIQ